MRLIIGLSFLLVILLVTAPVVATPAISSISPAYGYRGTTTTVTISGTNLDVSSAGIKLMKDSTNISDVPITSQTASAIVCTFPSDLSVGTWSVIVVNKTDNSESNKLVDAFTEREAISISSVSPTSGRTNNVSTKISIVGEGLSHISGIYLYNSAYSNSSSKSPTYTSATRVNATLDLTGKSLDTYQVCVVDNYGKQVCGLSFKIISDTMGSLEVSSSPSGATLYLDGEKKGTTPMTINDLDVGSYKLILKKDGYVDWTRTAKITNGGTTTYDANLEKVATVTTTTPPVIWTTPPTTVRTTVKSTLKTPTPWPSSTPTTAESPVGPLVIIGAVGLAIIVLRKH